MNILFSNDNERNKAPSLTPVEKPLVFSYRGVVDLATEAVALQYSLSQKKVNQSIGTQAVAANQQPSQHSEYVTPATEVVAEVLENGIDPALAAARKLVAEIRSQQQSQTDLGLAD